MYVTGGGRGGVVLFGRKKGGTSKLNFKEGGRG